MHVGRWPATKQLACVAPGGSQENIHYIHLRNVNKAAHFGFETQRRRHQESKTGVPVAPQKGPLSAKNIKIGRWPIFKKKQKKKKNNLSKLRWAKNWTVIKPVAIFLKLIKEQNIAMKQTITTV